MSRKNRNNMRGPLPGDRQGMSGADAGRDSMRIISDRSSPRRDTVDQRVTASTIHDGEDDPISSSQAPPTRSVLQDMMPATTLEGRNRQRMRWTDEVNRQLLRCYYTITNLETNLTGYRPLLHEQFIQIFPELNFLSEQRLADQIRIIHRNNRIPLIERQNIKQQVSDLISAHNNNNEDTDIPDPQDLLDTVEEDEIVIQTPEVVEHPLTPQIVHQNEIEPNRNHTNLDEYLKLKDTFFEILTKYIGTDPTLRPVLPKLQTSYNVKNIIENLNNIIRDHIEQNNVTTLEDLHVIIYSAAKTATVVQNKSTTKINKTPKSEKNNQNTKPPWERRLENKIAKLRKDIGQLTQYLNEKLSVKKQNKINKNNRNRDGITDDLDKMKQKLQALAKRLRRYKKSNQRRKENKLFEMNQKRFYCNLNKDQKITEPPNMAQVQTFWENIWSKEIQHNPHTTWLTIEETETAHIEDMPQFTINTEDVTTAINKSFNWKAPGPDKIHNYWLKYLTTTHTHLADIFNNLIKEPQNIPSFLTQGITYLKPKDADTANPAKYRPITCLPTIYKLLTSIIMNKINVHITRHNIIPEEQKGCRKGSRGCKEQLIIDAEIHNQAKQKHRNLHYAYIDYQKAFDSVPHSWLLHVLKLYKIDAGLVQFLERAMSKWTTTLNITLENKHLKSSPIRIARGIFQGDSLSPLWFCLALNPLSRILNNTGYGYTIEKGTNLTHLLYMDDIKLYAPNRKQLDDLLKLTEKFSNDIKMKFGTDKCKINCIVKGKYKETHQHTLTLQEGTIDNMEQADSYKYLGYLQSTSINHTKIKQDLTTKYKERLTKILKTQLSARNKTKAINTYAVPILTYSFGIINWTDTDLDTLNRVTRTILFKHNTHHIHSATERFTLNRKLGGRGFIDIKNLHYTQINNLRSYFIRKANDSPLHRAIKNLTTSGTPLHLKRNLFNPLDQVIKQDQKLEKWKQKPLHGKYPHQLDQDHIDKIASNAWLTNGNIFSETEGFLIAIQDQIIKTRNYSKYILKDNTIENDKCRLCHRYQETIDHITSGCPILANKEYIHRHDNVAKQIHQKLAIKYNLTDTTTPYYKYTPTNVLENQNAKLYWNRDITTDKTTPNNRPDITLTLKSTKTTFLIDISIPNTENLRKKHQEKIQKYIPLAEEIKDMWHQNTVKIIPVIISSTGVIPKTLHDSIDQLQLDKNIFIQLQKSTILNTCSIVRRSLNTDYLPHE